MSGSCGSSIFSFLRNLHAAFHRGCANLHSHQQCIKVYFPLHPQPAFVVCILDDSHSDWSGGNFSAVSICISFMARDVKQFFMYLLAICTSFENCSVHLFIF
jgi:hypothetical protein